MVTVTSEILVHVRGYNSCIEKLMKLVVRQVPPYTALPY